MTSRIYHSGYTTKETADFKSIPFNNATIDFKDSEASTAKFNSPQLLKEGDRIRIVGDNHREFGGQIIKPGEKLTDGSYSYECIDYTRLFFGKADSHHRNKTSYTILKSILTQWELSFAGLKKTKKKHKNVMWKSTSLWDIIQQLRWLDYKAGQYIECYVNVNGTLIYKPLAETSLGYVFNNAYDYSQDYDASNIITGSLVTRGVASNNSNDIAKVNASADMIARWGYIDEIEVCEGSSSTSTSTKSNSTTNKDATKIVNELAKKLSKSNGYKWVKGCSSASCISSKKAGDCHAMSEYIYKYLKSEGVICKIVQYGTSAANNHRTVRYKKKSSGSWVDFPYSGLDNYFKNTSKSKTSTNVVECSLGKGKCN